MSEPEDLRFAINGTIFFIITLSKSVAFAVIGVVCYLIFIVTVQGC
jgi:hypothetical protein